ncbi:MAG: 1,2-phenylacetyl-CoA epoxidase subunit PaaC [Acidimicrobiia bacterium]
MSDWVISGAPQGMPDVDLESPVRDLVAHGDDNLILSQRLGEWISNAPDLELDIALGNIALDHLGVARALYTRAGELEGAGRAEDDFAMRRTERQFLNVLLVEQPNGDFAATIVRQYFFDVYQSLLWPELARSEDDVVAGIAGRAAKENAYHLEFSHSWLRRLGDGTEESHRRMQAAIDDLWRFTAELATDAWTSMVMPSLAAAGLVVPDDSYQRTGGRDGFHTEHLGFIVAEMQWMDRTYPGLKW